MPPASRATEPAPGLDTSVARRQPGGPPKGDRRREAILDAVEELLSQGSIADLSVERIASAAGISRSGFYFYYESKYAALGDALSGVWEQMSQAAGAFFGGSDEPPTVYVQDAIRGVADLWRRHEALLVGMFEASASDPGARGIWEAWLDRWGTAIAERIRVERDAGRAPAAPPDADALARTLLLMNERVLYDDRRRNPSAEPSAVTVDALVAVWLAAVWGERSGS